jgi:internalin A
MQGAFVSATSATFANIGFRERLFRFFRFNLRSALLLVAILCGVLAWASRDMHMALRQSQLFARVERLGGTVDYVANENLGFSAANLIATFWDARLAARVDAMSFRNTELSDDDLLWLKPALLSMPETQFLDLTNTRVTDAGIASLADCVQLMGLHLSGTRITDAAAPHLASLPQLAALDVSQTQVTDAFLGECEIAKLRSLQVGNTKVTDAGVMAIQRRHPQLTVHVNSLRIAALEEVAPVPVLQLNDPFFGNASLERLDFLRRATNVLLDNSRVSAAGLRRIAGNPNISNLFASNTNLDDESLATIATLSELDTLDLRGTKVTDRGLAHLAKLPRLRMLWLDGPQITDAGLKDLGRLAELRFLCLDASAIDGSGLAQLAGLVELERLMLDATPVTDDSLKNLPILPRLQILDLEKTAISDAGLIHLHQFPALESVLCRESKITPDGLEFFKQRQLKAPRRPRPPLP